MGRPNLHSWHRAFPCASFRGSRPRLDALEPGLCWPFDFVGQILPRTQARWTLIWFLSHSISNHFMPRHSETRQPVAAPVMIRVRSYSGRFSAIENACSGVTAFASYSDAVPTLTHRMGLHSSL